MGCLSEFYIKLSQIIGQFSNNGMVSLWSVVPCSRVAATVWISREYRLTCCRAMSPGLGRIVTNLHDSGQLLCFSEYGWLWFQGRGFMIGADTTVKKRSILSSTKLPLGGNWYFICPACGKIYGCRQLWLPVICRVVKNSNNEDHQRSVRHIENAFYSAIKLKYCHLFPQRWLQLGDVVTLCYLAE